jgi:hypothetical protein
MRLISLVLLTTFLMAMFAWLVKSCEPNPEVIVQIEFPSKKQDRHQMYWFLTMARGYEI